MAAVPIKFRCHHCQQLLGVSRNRAGGVVACPRCAAELVVPEPDESVVVVPEPAVTSPATATAYAPPDTGEPLDAGIPLGLLNIRPEDIRVEPGLGPAPFRLPDSQSVAPAGSPVTQSSPRFTPEPEPVDDPPADPRPARTSPSPMPPPPPPPPPTAPPPPDPVTFGVDDLMTGVPIEVDTSRRPSPMRTIRPPARPSDLVLPRSVVAAWSLFVLLALALAFTAGLLAGHYVWRVH